MSMTVLHTPSHRSYFPTELPPRPRTKPNIVQRGIRQVRSLFALRRLNKRKAEQKEGGQYYQGWTLYEIEDYEARY